MPSIFRITNLEYVFPGQTQPVLHDINWLVEEGGHCALIGANGSGKSTLLGLLCGNLWPSQGRICWYGPQGVEDSPIYGRSISALISPALQENIQKMAFSVSFKDALLGAFDQSPFSFASMDVEEEKFEKALEVAEELACVNLLTMPLPTLSQGQLRILLCARAILRRPRLCLLDEALDGLDEKHKNAFFTALTKFAPHTTIILTSHRKAGIPAFCEQKRYLEAGRLLPEARFYPVHIDTQITNPTDTQSPNPNLPQRNKEPLLKLENVDVFIDRQRVLYKISWQTLKGEHWRISGPNGSGKSTLLRLLAGAEFAASGGSIQRWLHGKETQILDEIHQGIRLVSDLTQALYGYDVNGLELVCSGFEQTVGLYREYSSKEQASALEAIQRFFPAGNGASIAQSSIRRLSTGQLRRLYLARALMGKPEILLLDEPCTGLDAQSRNDWFALLQDLSKSIQIIMVSHNDEDAPNFINREAKLSDGRLAIIR